MLDSSHASSCALFVLFIVLESSDASSCALFVLFIVLESFHASSCALCDALCLLFAAQVIEPHVRAFLARLAGAVDVGIVGGSDHAKIVEQMAGEDGAIRCGADVNDWVLMLRAAVTRAFRFVFSENGLVAYRDGALIGKEVSGGWCGGGVGGG